MTAPYAPCVMHAVSSGPTRHLRSVLLATLWLITLHPLLRAQVIISEFLASNGTVLADEDREYPDWIELYNAGNTTVNLGGWYLTDDPTLADKWRFPAVSLLPKGYLVVFASGKNRPTPPPLVLHTDFSLDAAGEFLALVQPDGQTIASQFAPTFPPQERDVSYGLAQAANTNVLAATGASIRFLVPTDGTLGTSWTTRTFTDTSWNPGRTALGYETAVPGFAVRNVKAATTVDNLSVAESVLANPGLQAGVATANSAVVNFYGTAEGGHYGDNLVFPGHTVGADIDDFVLEVTATITIPTAGEWTFGVNSDDGFGLDIGSFSVSFPDPRPPGDTFGVFNVPAPGDYPLRLVFYERGGGSCVELFAARGNFAAWSTTDFRLVGDTGAGGLAVRSVPIAGSGLGYRSLIATDVQTALKDRNASIYVRLPFTLPGPALESLTLNVRYDDGFVAYLNGTEVARSNAPSTLSWNSAATAEHPTDQAVQFESVNLSDRLGLLVTGTNILALHGLNRSAGDTDFLLGPELLEYEATGTAYRHFATATPGSLNSTGFLAFVADTRFTVNRGFFDQPFDVEIDTATSDATIYYTTNGTVPSPSNGFRYTGPLNIRGTTVLRAAAYKDGYQPSNADTQTYLFLDDVLAQSPDGSAPPGWPASWGANDVDYGMDPDIVNNPTWGSTLQDDLKSIPSFSIVMDLDDLFDSSTGIYANPGQDGRQWERPCSLELIHPDGQNGFQINAGIRIRGGFSRSTSNPKHAFRFFFRSDYGEPKLRYPLFGDDGTDTFDAIDLRTFQNYSWSFQGDSQGIFVRDQLCRDLQLAMGHQGERGEFYHLYINGHYWGLYNTCERPEASYGATYYGGNKEDYDVIKVDAGPYTISATDGTMAAWTRLYNLAQAGLASDTAYEFVQGNNPNGTPNPAYENLVEVDNLIDYELIIFYGGNLDAPVSNFLGNQSPNNWYGLRNRTNLFGGFRFFVHDAEHTLLNVDQDRTGPFSAGTTSVTKSSPQNLWQEMLKNPEFKIRAADHIHRHFFNGGLLTPEAVRARFLARTAEIQRAVVAESARWGDAQRELPLTRNNWQTTVNSVLNSYIPQRTAKVLAQLRTDGAYPTAVAPSFNQHGGNINVGFQLTMAAPAGTIYYTLNGVDPRLRGGASHPGALTYSAPVSLTRSTIVKARVLSGGTWSALNEATFTVIQTWRDLLVTELMYHPAGATNLDADEFEFVELKNVGTQTLDLSGVRFTNGIRYAFPLGTRVDPGQFTLLVANPAAFTSRYPGVPYSGVYTGRLDNTGESLDLVHAAGAPIFSTTYDDQAPWPVAADGTGFSLVPISPNANPSPTNAANWRASSAIGGSPGRDDPPLDIPTVWITEVLTHTDPPFLDSIELHNPNGTNAPIGNWYLSDDRSVPRKFRIPSPTVIPPGGYVVFDEADFNPQPGVDPSFNLSSYGEEVYLHSADATGNLTGFSDGFSFGAAANGVAFSRYTISTGEAQYPAPIANTLGTANTGPRVGPLVLNEIHYHPLPGDTEFVELKNLTSTNVPLHDPAFPTNHWRIDGIDFEFPPGAVLPGNGLALVVEGDPTTFRSRYSVPPEVNVYGPFTGVLQNNGETLTLLQPDHPDVLTNGVVVVPLIAVDRVRYSDLPPWPALASGTGYSLERIQPGVYGNDPANWRASLGQPSPGLDNSGNRRPVVTAGSDVQLEASLFPVQLTLEGYVLDDGQPVPPAATSVTWVQSGGPGPVSFADPTRTNTTAKFPGIGVYQLRLTASDGQFQSTGDVVVTLTRTPQPTTLVRRGSPWRYWDQGSLPATTWTSPGYVDTGWPVGNAQFGYSTDEFDEVTTISYGPDANNKYITSWFRHEFQVASAAGVRALTVGVLRDDGVVVYLNGIEIFRSNMPTDDILPTTRSSGVVGGADESTFYSAAVDPNRLAEGRNVLAVELHQSGPTSTDVSFDLELAGEVYPANSRPTADAGPDLTVDLAAGANLDGAVVDDGLPIPPGLLTVNWSRLSGPGTVTFQPIGTPTARAAFSTAGNYVLRLTASDGTLTATDDALVTVTGGQDPFEVWRTLSFTAAELANPSISGPDADPDNDTHTNYQEFIAGTLPKDSSSVLRFDSVESAGPPAPATRLQFTAISSKTYTVQYRAASDTGTWQKLQDVPAGTTRPAEVLDSLPTTARYYRLVTPATP